MRVLGCVDCGAKGAEAQAHLRAHEQGQREGFRQRATLRESSMQAVGCGLWSLCPRLPVAAAAHNL